MPGARSVRKFAKNLTQESIFGGQDDEDIPEVEISQLSANGRPVRKSAGRREMDPNFVNSTENINDAIGDLVEENKIIYGVPKQKKINKKKRARSPTPPPPPFSPVGFPTDDMLKSQEEPIDPYITMASDMQPINLTFNIPIGFHGPLNLFIDPATLLRLSTPPSTRQHTPFASQQLTHLPVAKRQCFGLDESQSYQNVSPEVASFIRKHGQPRGFCNLPPEIRNQIYRLVFVSKGSIEFTPDPMNVKHSANFLRTCRMVHTEGSSMLYGENQFTFRRCKVARNPFWSDDNKEVGYRDMRHFLAMIGPQNRASLRHLHIVLDDASKSHAALLSLKQDTDPRYANDSNLFASLKVIAKDCNLRQLGLTFWGKRSLCSLDIRFLEKLCAIEVDELHINPDNCWGGDKVEHRVLEILRKEMIRPEPLYEGFEKSSRARLVQHPPRW